MKQLTNTYIVNSTAHMMDSLSPHDALNIIIRQLPNYEITPEFIDVLKNYISSIHFEKYSLTPEAIKYLAANYSFDAAAWAQNDAPDKNIDIILDKDFVKENNFPVEKIICSTKKITPEIYNAYIKSNNDNIVTHLLLNYTGPEVTQKVIMDHASILKSNIFKIPAAKEMFKDRKFAEDFLNNNLTTTMDFIVSFMDFCHMPVQIEKYLNSSKLVITNDASALYSPEIFQQLANVTQQYSDKIIDRLYSLIYTYAPSLLSNKGILNILLYSCDNLSETLLITLSSCFLAQGEKQNLVNYGINHNYKSLLTGVTLQ